MGLKDLKLKREAKRKMREEIEQERLRLIEALRGLEPGTEAYKSTVEQIAALKNENKRISPQVLAAIVTGTITVAELLILLGYEKINIITSKAFGWLHHPKL